uniref:Uncharacterized protein n=1 Tax=Anguilla anguilla TaxID=7936 RepID=A0A0E9PS35_ANGAN
MYKWESCPLAIWNEIADVISLHLGLVYGVNFVPKVLSA